MCIMVRLIIIPLNFNINRNTNADPESCNAKPKLFRADLMEREGEAASMFSGTKTLAHIPSDIDDLKDKKGHVAED